MEVDRTLLQATASPSLESERADQVPNVLSLEQANTLIIGHWFWCTMRIARDVLNGRVAEI